MSPSRRLTPTMKDIAAASGVAQSTVSRVLNNAPTRVPIAAGTRERVLQAARELGYRPNPLARGLRGASTNLIGAVVRDFSDVFYAGVIEALVVESMAHGYNVVLGHVHGRLDEGVPLTTVLETRHTDAIVLLGDMQGYPELMADLRRSLVPVVGLWQGTSPLEFPTVNPDDQAGVRAGLEHLAALGHRRIGFLSADLPNEYRIREDAYADFMRERFGGVPDGYLRRCPSTLDGGESALAALMRLPEPPTAVAASTDLVGVGALHAAHGLGIPVPGRLSVVGFDDILIASHTVPALTTLRMPVGEIVGHGVAEAVALTRDPERAREPGVTTYELPLIVRDSTAPPD
ncbi:LacI family DNA-binding transcriptional regulator [Actinoplanes sp. LDG1-06]|uniref:LacI family DNA-binding transcriptional regulator n=1 Tax=Paractinoplanes ovalisporus TaxID=2810368 RepID=A0ABS2AUV9_9ACTN|nr:LacI family DNA-binding transcriptional regulator [Actinoplanes ovalisporus]MBM2622954.1 LacI family DNA-binding transcriptional regulator [Actinoplanes ovalisporus]